MGLVDERVVVVGERREGRADRHDLDDPAVPRDEVGVPLEPEVGRDPGEVDHAAGRGEPRDPGGDRFAAVLRQQDDPADERAEADQDEGRAGHVAPAGQGRGGEEDGGRAEQGGAAEKRAVVVFHVRPSREASPHPGLEPGEREDEDGAGRGEDEERDEGVPEEEHRPGRERGRPGSEQEPGPVLRPDHERGDRGLGQDAEHGRGRGEADGEGLAQAEEEVRAAVPGQERPGDRGPEQGDEEAEERVEAGHEPDRGRPGRDGDHGRNPGRVHQSASTIA